MTAFFDTRAALEKIRKQRGTPATSATSATQEGKSGPHVAYVADVAAPLGQKPKNEGERILPVSEAPHPPEHPNKVGVGGRPVTWTGKVVSLDEWRRLTEWERHGPDGKVWNGKTQQWEKSNEQ